MNVHTNKQSNQTKCGLFNRLTKISIQKKKITFYEYQCIFSIYEIHITKPTPLDRCEQYMYYEYVINLIIPIRSHFLCSTPHSFLGIKYFFSRVVFVVRSLYFVRFAIRCVFYGYSGLCLHKFWH